MSIQSATRQCVQFIIEGHTISTHSWNDGYDASFWFNTPEIDAIQGADERVAFDLEDCVLVSVDSANHGDSEDTTYSLNLSEFNPRKPLEVSLDYALKSIAIRSAIDRLRFRILTDDSELFTLAEINDAIRLKINELETMQAQARAAYLAD